MSPRNKKVAQDLLNDKIGIQQIEDRLFCRYAARYVR